MINDTVIKALVPIHVIDFNRIRHTNPPLRRLYFSHYIVFIFKSLYLKNKGQHTP